ncbi:MAG TPA: hypothetical protein DCZ95_12930 [Verrucomicrobia bacterium]|nr:MAG: hypothetical protein A2X46_11730 [Lentisphaerae bacterium GWF2_57_35]HBA84992.1 hypothetical protein [Verrucomicrobiota bacterium]
MNNIGFIGVGHMATALVHAFIRSKAIKPENIILSNRSKEKLHKFKKAYAAIQIAQTNIEVVKKSNLIFVCANTGEVIHVMKEISNGLTESKHVVIISGGLEMESVEKIFKGKISKLIPTLTCEVLEGTSLLCHNGRMELREKKYLEKILKKIGSVKVVREEQFAAYTVLSSCAPGLIASIFELFIESAVKQKGIDYRTSFEIILSSMFGTSKLLLEKNESFRELIGRVARKGGNTELGVNAFERALPKVYRSIFEKVRENEIKRNLQTRKQFGLLS